VLSVIPGVPRGPVSQEPSPRHPDYSFFFSPNFLLTPHRVTGPPPGTYNPYPSYPLSNWIFQSLVLSSCGCLNFLPAKLAVYLGPSRSLSDGSALSALVYPMMPHCVFFFLVSCPFPCCSLADDGRSPRPTGGLFFITTTPQHSTPLSHLRVHFFLPERSLYSFFLSAVFFFVRFFKDDRSL